MKIKGFSRPREADAMFSLEARVIRNAHGGEYISDDWSTQYPKNRYSKYQKLPEMGIIIPN